MCYYQVTNWIFQEAIKRKEKLKMKNFNNPSSQEESLAEAQDAWEDVADFAPEMTEQEKKRERNKIENLNNLIERGINPKIIESGFLNENKDFQILLCSLGSDFFERRVNVNSLGGISFFRSTVKTQNGEELLYHPFADDYSPLLRADFYRRSFYDIGFNGGIFQKKRKFKQNNRVYTDEYGGGWQERSLIDCTEIEDSYNEEGMKIWTKVSYMKDVYRDIGGLNIPSRGRDHTENLLYHIDSEGLVRGEMSNRLELAYSYEMFRSEEDPNVAEVKFTEFTKAGKPDIKTEFVMNFNTIDPIDYEDYEDFAILEQHFKEVRKQNL